MILYRPVGLLESGLIYASGLTAFPPRLPEQPIFYPVLHLEYARQIAFRWNTQSEPYAGYITAFEVDNEYASQFERQIVGGRLHEELWVPAERLDEFNRHILGQINVVDAAFGEKFTGWMGESAGLKGQDALSQWLWLTASAEDRPQDVCAEISANPTAVFLNYPFWQKHDFTQNGIDEKKRHRTFELIQKVWSQSFPRIALGISSQ